MKLAGAWSAAPTPFTSSLKIDVPSVKRMVAHHIKLGQTGLFIGGTCGEGPWLPRADLRKLTEVTTSANKGQMKIAVQVTDNSYAKVLQHIKEAKADGADIAILAEPWFTGPMPLACLEEQYLRIAENSTLPVGIYSRGAAFVPASIYEKILRHDNVCLFKDSSLNDNIMRVALAISAKRQLCLLTGYELGMVKYLSAGYHGVLAGGGILIGKLTAQMIEAAQSNDTAKLDDLQSQCDRVNYTVYGKEIKSWLTGLKYALVKLGVFSTTAGYLKYPVPKPVEKAIEKLIATQKGKLF